MIKYRCAIVGGRVIIRAKGDTAVSIEIERKYVIELPDFSRLREMSGYTVSEITQIYMPTVLGVSHRVRRRITREGTVYTETKKQRIDAMSAYEDEREIDESRYEALVGMRDTALRPITKHRHTFEYRGQLFEIDVYPEWKKSCIMETELDERTRTVEMPDFIRVIRDVTGMREYSNHSMAAQFPKELK